MHDSATTASCEALLESARGYRPIADYAVVGDCHGGALIAADASIDWCCLGRFDADPIFCRMLDMQRGGFLSTTPLRIVNTTRAYLAGTNVLRTEFLTAFGRLAITDFMPVGRVPDAAASDYVRLNAPGWLIRTIECVEGRVDVRVVFKPSVDFARRPATLCEFPGGIGIEGESTRLCSDLPLRIAGDRAECTVAMAAGQRRHMIVGEAVPNLTARRVDELLAITCAFWSEWIAGCRYRGPYQAAVHRSALTLKLMTYAPTGASVAALTTSLPERMGGSRNWDYRYCWVRDASLMLQALASLGYSGEAWQFYTFMHKALTMEPQTLQIMYGVGMERELPERELLHLAGYRASRPVRTGNGAYDQRQTDLYGYLLDGALTYSALGGKLSKAECDAFARVADFMGSCWAEPDSGLWESRGGCRHYVHSKAMCWVVMDRAIKLLGTRAEWAAVRDLIWRDIASKGVSPEGHFLQVYSGRGLDAAALQFHTLGLPAQPDLLCRTREAVERGLGRGDFLLRYTSEDGLHGGEGAFLACSFWHVDALLREGRGADARALFDRLLKAANAVGLYAEQIDPASREQLGNFPQAYTHLSLVNSAVNLELYDRYGASALSGSHANRARRSVWRTFGWRGKMASLVQAHQINLFSSKKSQLPLAPSGVARP